MFLKKYAASFVRPSLGNLLPGHDSTRALHLAAAKFNDD